MANVPSKAGLIQATLAGSADPKALDKLKKARTWTSMSH